MAQKKCPLDVILGSPELQEAWVADQCVRQSSLMQLRALARQLELLTGLPLRTWRCPPGVHLQPLAKDERRMRLPSGEYVVFNNITKHSFVQFPKCALAHKFAILSHVVDRGPINSSALHFLAHDGFLSVVQFGWYHGLWNSIKNSMKSSCKKRPWKAALGYLLVHNFNYYPWKSSQHWRAKQEALRHYMQANSASSPSFQAIKHRFSESTGLPCSCPAEETELFTALGNMRSFNRKGPLLKMMRWLSIGQCWEWLKPELPGLELIMGEMVAGDSFEDVQSGTARSFDQDAVEQKTKPPGTLQKAYAWLRRPSSQFYMDMICTVTKPLAALYTFRTTQCKNIQESMAFNMRYARGGLQRELTNVAQVAFYNEISLHSLMPDGVDASQDRVNDLIDFTLTLFHFRAEAALPETDAYPWRSILGLHPEMGVRQEARTAMLADWEVLLTAERLGHSHAGIKRILDAVAWADNKAVRLLLMANELEGASVSGPCTTYVLQGFHQKVGDEKAAEDMHQFIRDETRRRRYTSVTPPKVMRSVIEADIPGKRRMDGVTVDIEDVCNTTRSGPNQTSCKRTFSTRPSEFPASLNQITPPARPWHSPIAAT